MNTEHAVEDAIEKAKIHPNLNVGLNQVLTKGIEPWLTYIKNNIDPNHGNSELKSFIQEVLLQKLL